MTDHVDRFYEALTVLVGHGHIKQRLIKHNTNRGAKSTKGYTWVVIYKRYFKTKSAAMSYEYKLKNNKKKRIEIIKNEDFNFTTI